MGKPLHHHPRKRFGQNFLQDGRIVDKIVAAIAASAGQHIVEIGPGRGAITRGLLDSGAQVTALEIDRDLIAHLLLHFGLADNFTLMEADALRFDYTSLATPTEQLRVVGNLPYNISSPLIFLLLQHRKLIKDMYFMLQKEVVERMAAESGGKSYGRLSVMVQYHCEVTPLFQVPPGAFYPAPKVDSARGAIAAAATAGPTGNRHRDAGQSGQHGVSAAAQNAAQCAQGNDRGRIAPFIGNRLVKCGQKISPFSIS